MYADCQYAPHEAISLFSSQTAEIELCICCLNYISRSSVIMKLSLYLVKDIGLMLNIWREKLNISTR